MNNKGFSEEIKRKCIPIFSRNKNVTIIKKENGFILCKRSIVGIPTIERLQIFKRNRF